MKCDRYMGHDNTFRKNSNENKIHSHFEKYDILFDVDSCKCKTKESCRFQSLFRVPNKEREFIIREISV